MNWIIKYTVKDNRGIMIESKKIRVKNKPNDFIAKASLGTYLKKKHPNLATLIIHDCYEDNNFMNFFNDMINDSK